MTTERDFDRIAAAWLAEGPDELSVRVLDSVVDQVHLTGQRRSWRSPWRLPDMSTPVRIAGVAVIGVLVLGVTVVLGGPSSPGVGGPPAAPTAPPSTTTRPSASAFPAPALTQTFTSDRHGYSVRLPADWTATRATASWTTGIDTLYDDPGLDKLGSAEMRLAVASAPLAPGQTPDAWMSPYCRSGSSGTACGREVTIGGHVGFMDEDGVSASGGTVESNGVMYGAVVVVDGRGYTFLLDGHVNQSIFDALMASVTFDPASATD